MKKQTADKSRSKNKPTPKVDIAEPRGKRGRPTEYSDQAAAEICRRVAAGETLRQVCRSPHLPGESTVRSWSLDDREGFAARYARARALLLETWADEIVEISDDGTNDWMQREGKDGEGTAFSYCGENVDRSKLRADSRKWLLSKLNPGIYADRLQTELSGKNGGPIETKDHSDLDVAKRVAYLLGCAMRRKTEADGEAAE